MGFSLAEKEKELNYMKKHAFSGSITFTTDMFYPSNSWNRYSEGKGIQEDDMYENGEKELEYRNYRKAGDYSKYEMREDIFKEEIATIQSVGEFQLDIIMEEFKKDPILKLVFLTETQLPSLQDEELIPVPIEILSSPVQPILHEGCYGPALTSNTKEIHLSELFGRIEKETDMKEENSFKITVVTQPRKATRDSVSFAQKLAEVRSNLLCDATVDWESITSNNKYPIFSRKHPISQCDKIIKDTESINITDKEREPITSIHKLERLSKEINTNDSAKLFLSSIVRAIIAGFVWFCKKGPLLGLPCEDILVSILDIHVPSIFSINNIINDLHIDTKGENTLSEFEINLSIMIRDVYAGSFMLSRPCIYEVKCIGETFLPGGPKLLKILRETENRNHRYNKPIKNQNNEGQNPISKLVHSMRGRLLRTAGVTNTPFSTVIVEVPAFESIGITTRTILNSRELLKGNTSGDRIFNRIQLLPIEWSPLRIGSRSRRWTRTNLATGWEYYEKIKMRNEIEHERDEEEEIKYIDDKVRNGVTIDWNLVGKTTKAQIESNSRLKYLLSFEEKEI